MTGDAPVDTVPDVRSPLDEMFDYVPWAVAQVIEACQSLSIDQIDAPIPGTYGSIRATLAHVVSSDGAYLHRLRPHFEPVAGEELDLAGMAAEIARHRPEWAALAREGLDADRVTVTQRRDGTFFRATVGVRVLQVIQHATDHLSQVNTGLTLHGVAAPWIGAWDYGESTGAVVKFSDGPEQ